MRRCDVGMVRCSVTPAVSEGSQLCMLIASHRVSTYPQTDEAAARRAGHQKAQTLFMLGRGRFVAMFPTRAKASRLYRINVLYRR
jgi:hypothetical protein